MYSIVLMMAMASPADAPQGLIFERGPIALVRGKRGGGCSGAAVPASGASFLGLRSRAASSGCAGSGANAYRAVSSGCTGGVSSYGCAGSSATAYGAAKPIAMAAPQQMTGPARRLVLRLEIAHAINVKERSGELDYVQAAHARAVMAAPRSSGSALASIASKGPVAAAGDHPFLEWIMANWKDILTTILALFGK